MQEVFAHNPNFEKSSLFVSNSQDGSNMAICEIVIINVNPVVEKLIQLIRSLSPKELHDKVSIWISIVNRNSALLWKNSSRTRGSLKFLKRNHTNHGPGARWYWQYFHHFNKDDKENNKSFGNCIVHSLCQAEYNTHFHEIFLMIFKFNFT